MAALTQYYRRTIKPESNFFFDEHIFWRIVTRTIKPESAFFFFFVWMRWQLWRSIRCSSWVICLQFVGNMSLTCAMRWQLWRSIRINMSLKCSNLVPCMSWYVPYMSYYSLIRPDMSRICAIRPLLCPLYVLICPLHVLIGPLYVLLCPLYVLICPLYIRRDLGHLQFVGIALSPGVPKDNASNLGHRHERSGAQVCVSVKRDLFIW